MMLVWVTHVRLAKLNHFGKVCISALSASIVSENLKSAQFKDTPIDGPADYVF